MKCHVLNVMVAIILTAALIGCHKDVLNEQNEIALATPNSSGTDCRAAGIGYLFTNNNGEKVWLNILLKWYDGSRKLKNVKFHLDWSGAYGPLGDDLNLDYGEVVYAGDEVKVKDVYSGTEILRIKLDALNRPVTTWYYNPNSRSGYGWPVDTSYYYYDAWNRLETVVQHKTALSSQQPLLILNWKFIYDPVGNLVQIKSADYPQLRFEFKYDYSNINHGMATVNMFTAPTKMLEFLDLIKFEQHHQLKDVVWYAPYSVADWSYLNIMRDSESKVISYQIDARPFTHFTAWDCGGMQMTQSKNPTQEEFMKMIHH